MKKILLLVLVLAVAAAGIYYFAPGRQWKVAGTHSPGNRFTFRAATSSIGTVLGAETVNAIKGTVGAAGSAASGFVQDKVNGLVAGAVDTAKEAVVRQVADALGVPVSVTRTQRGSAGANAPGATSSQNVASGEAGTGGYEVCSAHAVNEIVSYALEFSSSSASREYAVDWGDGSKTQNAAPSSSKAALVAHSYGKEGNYMVTFRVLGSASVLAEREVCVRQ